MVARSGTAAESCSHAAMFSQRMLLCWRWSIASWPAGGFVPRNGTVVHDGSEGLVFDGRAILKKLYYLQAVLKAEALRALGGPTFDSAKSAAWYKLLLRYPAQCTEELSAAQCKAILRGDVPGEAVPRKRRRLALPMALGPPGLLAAAAVEEDGEVAGDLLPAPLAIADAAEADEASARSTSPRSSSKSSSRSMSDEIIGDAADEAPKRILGQRVWVEKHRGRKDVGWRVQCSQPDHPRCRLYKSVAQARKLGAHQPSAFPRSVAMARKHHGRRKPCRMAADDSAGARVPRRARLAQFACLTLLVDDAEAIACGIMRLCRRRMYNSALV